MEITCPSGLSGVIRGMKGREAQAFVDPQQVRTFGSMDTMLTNCWLETRDAGPYTLDAGRDGTERPKWPEVLIGDRFAALIDIRVATFGSDYDFDVKCQSCEQQYGWELSLRDLPRQPFPAETIEKIKAGRNSFDMDLPDGRVLVFKIGTGAEEKKIAQLKGGPGSTRKLGPVDSIFTQTLGIYTSVNDPIVAKTVGLATPIVGKNGEEMLPIPGGLNGARRYLEDLDFPTLLDVLDEMQRVDGGVQTTIETVCENCGWKQEIELPFQRSFFAPRPKRKTAATP